MSMINITLVESSIKKFYNLRARHPHWHQIFITIPAFFSKNIQCVYPFLTKGINLYLKPVKEEIIYCSIGGTYFYDNVDILWPGGMSVAPLGRPACGWDNEYCDESDPGTSTLNKN